MTMGNLFNKLRIGEMIGLSFGLVGLLFLGVIWKYHSTLEQSLADYGRLGQVFEAKKSHALNIGRNILAARRAEKDFLIGRELKYVEEVQTQVDQVLAEAVQLAAIDEAGQETGREIATLSKDYYEHFQAVVEAWRTKGLDHNSGLQGKFRDSVHELEAQAEHFKVASLYLQLLQIRRREKDLGLRREQQYEANVLELIQGFRKKTTASGLATEIKAKLQREINTYEHAFRDYAQTVLANRDIAGGKGTFRQAAHRIEAVLGAHFVPDLEADILQLRRREKDYLLRGDRKYVEWAQREIGTIRSNIGQSAISAQQKSMLIALLESYEKDFHALVAQNDQIAQLTAEMRVAVARITSLAEENVTEGNRAMVEMSTAINSGSWENARLMLWIVLAAGLLGIFFAIVITFRITRPLALIGGVLGKLAHSDPIQRIPHAGGRNEVSAMAGAVNTLLEHRERLVAWSMATMREDEGSLRKVVDSIAPGVFVADENGTVVAFNRAAEELFGTRSAEIMGHNVAELIPTLQFTGKGPTDTAAEALGMGQEVVGKTADSRPLALWLTLSPYDSDGRRLYTALVIDIIARKEAEADLRQAKRAKRDLLTIMSQEIGTLMDGIVRMSEQLVKTRQTTKKRQYAQAIQATSVSLIDILNVVLGYTHRDAGAAKLEERPFEPHRLLGDLSSFFARYAREKAIEYSIHLSHNLPEKVYGDPDSLRQVLVDLLSNAVKFTERGRVTLGVEATDPSEGTTQMQFKIRDTGIGMDSEMLADLFGPAGSEERAIARKYRKAGQGLAFTRSLVELMGGEIQVESEPGKGSLFTVTLPMREVR
jgi:PAS domain S-box-containing protein